MTDVNQIARRIVVNMASLLDYIPALADFNYVAVTEEIAAALIESDAAGYRRGVDEAAKVCDLLPGNNGRQAAKVIRELQRGKGEGA